MHYDDLQTYQKYCLYLLNVDCVELANGFWFGFNLTMYAGVPRVRVSRLFLRTNMNESTFTY